MLDLVEPERINSSRRSGIKMTARSAAIMSTKTIIAKFMGTFALVGVGAFVALLYRFTPEER